MRNLYTNYGLVLTRIWLDPDATLAQIAADIGVKERAAYMIVRELASDGYIVKRRVGRRNKYFVDVERALNFRPLPKTTVREQIIALAETIGMRWPKPVEAGTES